MYTTKNNQAAEKHTQQQQLNFFSSSDISSSFPRNFIHRQQQRRERKYILIYEYKHLLILKMNGRRMRQQQHVAWDVNEIDRLQREKRSVCFSRTHAHTHNYIRTRGSGWLWMWTRRRKNNHSPIYVLVICCQSASVFYCSNQPALCRVIYIRVCVWQLANKTHSSLQYCAKTFSIASGDVDTYKIRRRTLFLKSYGDAFFANASDRVGKKQIRVVLSDEVLYWRSVLHLFTIRQHFKMLLLPSSFVTITCLDWSVPRNNNNNNNLIVQ